MQLSDLLGAGVYDRTGNRLGTVTDVRLAVHEAGTGPTVFGLIVSPRTGSSYLGYERSQVQRPAALAALLRWRHRGTFLVLCNDIADRARGQITLRDGFTRYSPVLRSD